MHPTRTVAVVGLSLVVYLGCALGGRLSGRGEIFPFFTWDLFSHIPAHVSAPVVYLHRAAGRPLDPPVPLFESGMDHGRRYVAAAFARSLNVALAHDPERAAAVREVLATNHLPPVSEWSLVLEEYDPLQRWTEGTLQRIEVARFATPDASPWVARWDQEAGTLDLDDRVVRILPRPAGTIDGVRREGDWLLLVGWAGAPERGVLPDRLLVFLEGEAVHSGGVGALRPDVAGVLGQPGLRRSGFRFYVPTAGATDRTPTVLAVFGDVARPVPPARAG